jgi:hypothetical protein
MSVLSALFYILAYLSAVVDGVRRPTGLYPEANTGRLGVRRFARAHPWIVVGAVCGVVGTVLAAA